MAYRLPKSPEKPMSTKKYQFLSYLHLVETHNSDQRGGRPNVARTCEFVYVCVLEIFHYRVFLKKNLHKYEAKMQEKMMIT